MRISECGIGFPWGSGPEKTGKNEKEAGESTKFEVRSANRGGRSPGGRGPPKIAGPKLFTDGEESYGFSPAVPL